MTSWGLTLCCTDSGTSCGATCWVSFDNREADDTIALKVEVLGRNTLNVGVAGADMVYVLDCPPDVGVESPLTKDIMAAKQTPMDVRLIPYNEAPIGGMLAANDRAFALRGWCRCARDKTGLGVLSL